jgi:hypothetical protein
MPIGRLGHLASAMTQPPEGDGCHNKAGYHDDREQCVPHESLRLSEIDDRIVRKGIGMKAIRPSGAARDYRQYKATKPDPRQSGDRKHHN